ncbi:MAG: N-formylglutamate deformylase [Rhodospirillales bacterium]|jgi:N-formylglutamate deformylase|nr:N-formylglutamate deformylase [Rhodospirillales bacterium]MBT4625133.1 N-formylglutamate deformylase [Rhodospirillales bacterium]MBT5353337.1 N-formylglutamate deformylase [Rhodospirillales bacterium]MBT5519688.1 N-formylglutamate deformylase [Rhodospirillales bacterium]MBT6109234.1 N-formylglutamate deformylase [Rhodospirillales bacterium]
MSDPVFHLTRGDQPVLVSCPHVGTHVPDHIAARFTPEAKILADTDWYVDWLYGDAAGALGIPMLTATHSRYVIDLNRRPDGATLYSGADNTELCPTTTFEREAIYVGDGPDEAEIAERVDAYSKPYHNKLRETLDDMVARHGVAVLIEGHSIQSHVPRFFDGKLPDLNLGTANGESADADLAAQVMSVFKDDGNYTSVLNGRFTGGYITRHFGEPDNGIHALQLEMAQCCYMDEESPFPFRADLAGGVQPVIAKMLETALAWARAR